MKPHTIRQIFAICEVQEVTPPEWLPWVMLQSRRKPDLGWVPLVWVSTTLFDRHKPQPEA